MADPYKANYHAHKALEIHNRTASTAGIPIHQAQYDMSCAQHLATLALAYEQRTANLIEYVTKIDDTRASLPVIDEIKARLGLGASE